MRKSHIFKTSMVVLLALVLAIALPAGAALAVTEVSGNITLSLAPATDSGFVGTGHTVTVTALGSFPGGPGSPQPYSGLSVNFAVISGPNTGQSGSGTTDANGQATFMYNGTTPGIDTIQVSSTNELVTGPATATMEWLVPYTLTLVPESAMNAVGTSHTVTATYTMYNDPVANAQIHFEVISGPHSGASADVMTGGDGTAQWSYTGTTPGTDTIKAAVIYLVQDGLDNATAALDTAPDTEELISATATKYWVVRAVPCLMLGPSEATNTVGTSHIVTATVFLHRTITQDDEPVEGAPVHFEVIDGPHKGTKGDAITNSIGIAHWSYTGTVTGQDTIQATAMVEDQPLSLTVTKTWEDHGVPPVPELPTVALLGIGLLAVVGFVGVRRLRTSKA